MTGRKRRPPPVRCCDECGQHDVISIRGRDGRPELCRKCARLPSRRVCALCGEWRRCYSNHQGPSICRRCAPDPTPRCSHCAQRKRIAALTNRGPVCVGCERAAARGRPRCRICRFSREPAAWVDGEPVCSKCAGTPVIAHCPGCQRPRHDWRGRRCPDCKLAGLLAELRGSGDPDAVAALEPLLGQLERHRKPLSAIAWLERSPAAPTFHAMLRGKIAISHDTLDQHDVGQATAYLRSWLVAHTVLAPREGAPRPLRTLGTTRAASARRSSRPGTRRGLRTMEARGRLRPQAEDRAGPPEQQPRLLRQPARRDQLHPLAARQPAHNRADQTSTRRRVAERAAEPRAPDPRTPDWANIAGWSRRCASNQDISRAGAWVHASTPCSTCSLGWEEPATGARDYRSGRAFWAR